MEGRPAVIRLMVSNPDSTAAVNKPTTGPEPVKHGFRPCLYTFACTYFYPDFTSEPLFTFKSTGFTYRPAVFSRCVRICGA